MEYCRSLLNLGLITVHCPSLRYTHFGGYNHSRMAFLFADARRFLPAFDIFVLLSTQPDPFPTVVLEAMGAGVPVIATAHGGPLEMITHQETGILVTPSDAEEPAAAISGLASDPSLRHAIGEAGRERFHQCFGLEPYLGQIQQIYSKVLENE